MKISEMDCEQIITRFLEDRGVDATDPKLRGEYDLSFVEKARRGDPKAVIELLKIGHHYLTTSMV